MLIEQDHLTYDANSKQPKIVKTLLEGNNPITVASCEACGTVLWAISHNWLEGVLVVRVGVLEHADKFVEPKSHWFVRSKHPWIVVPEGVPTFEALPGPEAREGSSVLGAEGVARVTVAAQRVKEAEKDAQNN
jgi:hypothetical protein